MTTKQLSVFLENKSGMLVKVLDLLKAEGIQIVASTIADTADYGIFRIICSEPQKAYDVLRANGIAVSLCDVLAIELDDTPGRAAETIGCFASEGINIAYLYSFLLEGKGVLIFRTDDVEAAVKIISRNGFQFKLL